MPISDSQFLKPGNNPKGKLLFKPYPKQALFLASEADEALIGGARGGGKTLTLIIDAALKARAWHYEMRGDYRQLVIDKRSIDYPEYRGLILRKNYKDLETNFLPESHRIYKHGLKAKWYAHKQCYIFPSGATIYLGHCEREADLDKYIGGNYHYLGIEEANQFTETAVKELGGSIRSTNSELKPFKRFTTNPGGVGHLWLKRKFIDACPPEIKAERYNKKYNIMYKDMYPGEVSVDEDGSTVWFVPCGIFDNPHLLDNDPNYVAVLKKLDPVRRRMWLDGDWDAQGGTFFEEWNALHHVIPAKDFYLDKEVHRVYRVIDYGSTKPFACMFLAVDPLGYVTVFDEIYEKHMVPSTQAKMIKEKTKQWGIDENDVWMTILDPAMKVRDQEAKGSFRSVMDIYFEEGIRNINLGNNTRVPGWVMFKEYLHVPDVDEGEGIPGRPFLVFTSICTKAIETIPTLVQSPSNPDDVNTMGEDHIADAIRYGLMYLQRPSRKKNAVPMKEWQKKLADKAKGTPAQYDPDLVNVL